MKQSWFLLLVVNFGFCLYGMDDLTQSSISPTTVQSFVNQSNSPRVLSRQGLRHQLGHLSVKKKKEEERAKKEENELILNSIVSNMIKENWLCPTDCSRIIDATNHLLFDQRLFALEYFYNQLAFSGVQAKGGFQISQQGVLHPLRKAINLFKETDK